MNICVITHTFPRFEGDNVAPFMGEFVKGLINKGNTVTVLAPFTKKLNWKNVRFKLVTYKYIYPDSLSKIGYSQTLKGDKNIPLIMILLSPFLYIFGFISLLKLVKSEKFDLISAHWIVPNGFIATMVSLITKIPFTVTIPGSDVYMGKKNILFKMLIGIASNKANFVISDNQAYLNELNKLGYSPANSSVIRYGVDPKKFYPKKDNKLLKKKLGIDANETIILAAGRFVEKKGFINLIKSAPNILKGIKNARFILVGDGDQKEELVGLIHDLNLENKFILPGMISFTDLPDYYNIADVIVAPSIKDKSGNIDASPVSLMESISCGVPIVATTLAAGDLHINDRIGYLINQNEVEEISSSVIKILGRKIDRQLIHKWAVENLSVNRCVEEYLKIFKKL